MPKHRARNIDRIIKGEFFDDVDRRIVGVSQSLGKLGSGRHFNFVRQSPDHLTETPDLIFSVATCYQ